MTTRQTVQLSSWLALCNVYGSAFAADFITEQWRFAEISLTSPVLYANPFQDVDVTATFTGPGGAVLVRPAFWDGGTMWRIRFAPTVTGLWSMATSCTDPSNSGLHAVSNTVQCNAYNGSHAIYRHGFLKVAASGRYFCHADGTPFFYLGDTHWLFTHERFETSNVAGVSSQFKYTVDKRVSQGFTVFQSEAIHIPHGGTHADPTEEAHCDLRDGLTEADLSGFVNMDRKFKYIADQGLVHAHAGITWATEPIGHATYTEAYMAKLGRYWAARYGAFPVLWTVAQEIDPNMYGAYDASTMGLWYAGAQGTADNDAYAQPLGAHTQAIGFGFSSPVGSWWCSQPCHSWWPLQMQGELSGHSAAKSFWQNEPAKPVVLYETPYESFWTDTAGARGAGYKAFQWGMCGYGYGANGVWNDLYSSSDYGTGYQMPDLYLNWYDGANLAGGAQMRYIKDFYTSLNWWKLTPRFDDAAWSAFVDPNRSLLSSDDNKTYVVYFFGSGVGTGVLKGMAEGIDYTALWFNPRTGVYADIGTFKATAGQWTVPERATSEDWILLVFASGLVATAGAQLSVVNGDFSDLTGLGNQGGGWYSGVPAGWSGNNNWYTVHAGAGAMPPTANMQTLSPLSQAVGTLTNTCDVVLTFDFSQPWNAEAVILSASILADSVVIASGTFNTLGSGLTLVAANAPSGSAISVRFVSETPSGAPGLDNVAVAAFATNAPTAITRQPQASVALPEPMSATLSVGAAGVPPFSYQWRADGSDLAGATNADLTVVRPGNYSVAVTAANQASVTSEVSRVFQANALPVLNGDFTSDHLASGWNSDWSRLGPPSATSGWNASPSDGALNHDRFPVWTAYLSAYAPTYALERSVTAQAKIRVSFKAGCADRGGRTVYVDLIVGGTTNTREFVIGQALEAYTAVFNTEQQTGAVTLRFRGDEVFVTDVGSVRVTRFRPGTFMMLL